MQDTAPQDQGGPRGAEPFPGIGRAPTDMRYFSRRQIVIRNESSVQREKESILEKHMTRFSQRLCNTGHFWTVLCWAEGWERQLGRG